MISNVDYTKLAMLQGNDKTEIDPILRRRTWSAVILGLGVFWSLVALAICNLWLIH